MGVVMWIVSIADDFIEKHGADVCEFIFKYGRPCIVVARLRFRGRTIPFSKFKGAFAENYVLRALHYANY